MNEGGTEKLRDGETASGIIKGREKSKPVVFI